MNPPGICIINYGLGSLSRCTRGYDLLKYRPFLAELGLLAWPASNSDFFTLDEIFSLSKFTEQKNMTIVKSPMKASWISGLKKAHKSGTLFLLRIKIGKECTFSTVVKWQWWYHVTVAGFFHFWLTGGNVLSTFWLGNRFIVQFLPGKERRKMFRMKTFCLKSIFWVRSWVGTASLKIRKSYNTRAMKIFIRRVLLSTHWERTCLYSLLRDFFGRNLNLTNTFAGAYVKRP